MLVKNTENRGQLEFVSLESMVPQDHLLRKIDAAIDFKKIYEFVEDLYCEDNGRPSVDPVVLFKIVLIQHIYGIPMRYTQYRGLAQVTNWVKLKFAAMNLKKLATWKWKDLHPAPDGGRRSRLRKNTPDISILFPFVFLFTNQKPALA